MSEETREGGGPGNATSSTSGTEATGPRCVYCEARPPLAPETTSALRELSCSACGAAMIAPVFLPRLLQTLSVGPTWFAELEACSPARPGLCPSCENLRDTRLYRGALVRACGPCSVVTLGPGSLFVLSGGRHGRARERARPAPTPKSTRASWLGLGAVGLLATALVGWAALRGRRASAVHGVPPLACEPAQVERVIPAWHDLPPETNGEMRVCLDRGVPVGRALRIGSGDVPIAELHFAHGVLTGPYVRYDVNGTRLEEGEFTSNVRTGLWTRYDAQGRRAEQQAYRGVPEGKFTSWYPSTAVHEDGSYRRGKKDGIWLEWGEDGTQRKSELWRDGVMVHSGDGAVPAPPSVGSGSAGVITAQLAGRLYGGQRLVWWSEHLEALRSRHDADSQKMFALCAQRLANAGVEVRETDAGLALTASAQMAKVLAMDVDAGSEP